MSRPTLAVAALGLALAGCGHSSTQRSQVASYLRQVNRVEHALARPLSTVTSVGNQFASEQQSGGTLVGVSTQAHEQSLQRAWGQIVAARAHLAAIKVPAPAANLQRLLVQLVTGQAQLTREMAQLVTFLPGYSQALRTLAPTTRRLQSSLARQSASTSYANKAAALRRFKAAVDGILRQLHQLRPPAVERPDYTTEVASVRGMSTSAGQLADALQGGSSSGDVRSLLLRFERAETLDQTVAAQKAESAAIRAYDRQASALSSLTTAAQQERLRLADNLS
ncbi:MAG TPA: hypothetical protein VMD09_02780 [Solirubrobacteraceae bacterium]|nr:hypothetical protein [Solirubrobacteraceae bacterium]